MDLAGTGALMIPWVIIVWVAILKARKSSKGRENAKYYITDIDRLLNLALDVGLTEAHL